MPAPTPPPLRLRAFGIESCSTGIPPRRQRHGGFALLITVTLLAFLVLLLVSLASLTRVETQVATNSQDIAAARQNALLALTVALGELQKTAGPDQRTTAPAVMGEAVTAVTAVQVADNGLAPPVDGTRYWTGVWGNKAAPESIFTSAPRPVLLRWLVSGNENASTITANAAGQITAPTVAAVTPFKPAQTVTQQGGAALAPTMTATTALAVNNQPAALLLGPKTAGANVASYVAAPLVEITSSQVAGLTGAQRIGRYAWWVGDEGVKAKYNLPDPYITAATPDSGASDASRDSRYRLLAAQRNGIEKITAFANANYPVAATVPTDPLYLGVGKTVTPAGIRLAAPAVALAPLQNHVHDLTTSSYGVLANSQFGGLRRDLTFHLDPRSGDTFLDGRNILPDGATPLSDPSVYPGTKYTAFPSLYSAATTAGGLGFTTLNVSPRLGPKWDQLKSYYKAAYDHPVDLEVQPAVDIDADPAKVKVQGSITPVILETRFLFALKSGPSIDTSVIIVLGNPYSRPLKASSGLNFRAAIHPNNYDNTRQDSQEWGIMCNYIGPVLAGFEGQEGSTDATKNLHKITSVFTRFQSGLGGGKLLLTPPLQADANPNARYHPHYYPILKFAPTPAGDGPLDPDKNNPALLERVYFQIPPGLLNLAPGEAKAYRIDSTATLPSETVNGNPFQVIPLQEMTDGLPTYVNHPCDPRFINNASLLPPGLLTGAALESGSELRLGMTLASVGGMDYILTLPGKPASVLQSLGPCGMYPTPTQNGGIPNRTFTVNVFDPTVRSVAGAGRTYRLFGNAGNESAGNSYMATHAETSLLGSFQISKRFDTAVSSGSTGMLRTGVSAITTSYPIPKPLEDEDNFVKSIDPFTATQAAWGQGYIGSPLRTAPNGRFILNDLPAAFTAGEIPVLSLAQFQHLDLTADDEALGTSAQPAYAVGNSRYNRLVSRAASRTDLQANNRSLFHSNSSDNTATALGDSPRWYAGLVPDLPKKTQVRRYDISYLLNTALWDDVFFSTVRPAAGSDSSVAPAPANRRLVYTSTSSPTLGQLRGADASAVISVPATLGSGESGRASAAQMLMSGSFNVNSTSTQAWIAFLSGLRGLGINPTPATTDRTPLSRSIRQTGAAVDDTKIYKDQANNVVAANETTYTGFRSLTDTQIATLAAEIVKQVRARGPFLSLAQFINRNLTAAAASGNAVADTGLSGALQQAIERAALNAFLNASSSIPPATGANAVGYPDDAFMPVTDATATPPVYSGISSYMLTPAWLNQADLLQSLAPALSARSDTFVIRTYGEALDPLNSAAAPATPVVKARVWCEAVVQRMPDYVDASQRPTMQPSLANPQNQTFGRRFRVVSFRWLSPDDI